MKTKISRVFFGILVIFFGAGLLGQALGWWELIGFTGWWTMIIIIPSIFLIISYGFRFWNTIMLGVGVLLLLEEQAIITDEMVFPIVIAALVILLGIRIAFGSHFKSTASVPGFTGYPLPNFSGQPDYSSMPEYNAIFSGMKAKNVSDNFASAKISAVFGYSEVDFTEIHVTRDAVIESSAVFGGVRIYAPRNCRVKVENSSVFGGCDNRAATLTDLSLPLVTIKASTAFGGTEIL